MLDPHTVTDVLGRLNDASAGPPGSHTSRSNAILAAVVGWQVFGTIFYLLRVISRYLMTRRWQLDDWLLFVAWIVNTLNAATTADGVPHGLGRPQATVSISDTIVGIKLGYTSRIFYISGLAFTKLAICVFYLRIFMSERKDCYAIYACLAFIVLTFIPNLLIAIFPCIPVSKLFAWTLESGLCLSDPSQFWASAIPNVLSDVWIMVVVQNRILRLRMKRVRKLALIAIVSTGWFVVVAAIIRIVRICTIIYEVEVDFAWVSYEIYLWTAVELNVGLFCACAPTLRPLISRMVPKSVREVSWSFFSGSSHSSHLRGSGSTPRTVGNSVPRAQRLPDDVTDADVEMDAGDHFDTRSPSFGRDAASLPGRDSRFRSGDSFGASITPKQDIEAGDGLGFLPLEEKREMAVDISGGPRLPPKE